MRTETDPVTGTQAGAAPLGAEERSDEAPRGEVQQERPAPDPEVVAKPMRRQFTAAYRLRIVEEADRCTRPGEVGRLLRREGLYTSHLSAWRKARRSAARFKALTVAKKRGAKPAEVTTPSCPRCASSRRRSLASEKELATAHTILDVAAGKISGLLGLNLNNAKALLMAASSRSHCRSAWRRRAGRWACRGRPSTVVTGPAPGRQQPRTHGPPGPCARPNANASSTRLAQSNASSTAHRPRSSRQASGRRAVPVLGAHDVSDPGCELQPVRERRNQLTHPTAYTKPELVATAPNQDLEPAWDDHAPAGAESAGRTGLPVRVARHLQPICGRVDGRSEPQRARRWPPRLIEQTCLKQDIEPQAHPAFGSRRADDQQVHRATARRPRGDPLAQPPPGQRRQPLLRGAVQDPEVPCPDFPGRFEDAAVATMSFCRSLLPLVQHRASTCSGSRCSPPHDVHYGKPDQVLEQRERTLRLAWDRHPERSFSGTPKPQPLPQRRSGSTRRPRLRRPPSMRAAKNPARRRSQCLDAQVSGRRPSKSPERPGCPRPVS